MQSGLCELCNSYESYFSNTFIFDRGTECSPVLTCGFIEMAPDCLLTAEKAETETLQIILFFLYLFVCFSVIIIWQF